MRPKAPSFNTPIDETYEYNAWGDSINRTVGRKLGAVSQITANNETKIFNIFKFTGTVRILNQWAIITDDTALTNCTNVYASVYDGTTSTNLTAPGIDLSGAPVGSLFTKDKIAADTYSLVVADQARVLETLTDKRIGRPFIVNAKSATDCYIRFHITTNTTLDFSMQVAFEYQLFNGSTLGFA